MPVCNLCKKNSNCLTIDSCEFCGARDWDLSTVLRGSPKGLVAKYSEADSYQVSEQSGSKRNTISPEFTGLLEFVGKLLIMAVVLATAFGGLWLMVAVIKWMWNHS